VYMVAVLALFGVLTTLATRRWERRRRP
jgi:hypothetical protein